MKKGNLLEGILFVLGGIILLCAALLTDTVLDSISIVIFSILGKLEIIDDSRLIVLYLGGYLVFQIVIGIVIFNQLLKKYE